MFYDNDDYQPQHRSKNYNVPPDVHIMNKNEKRVLRKLKSQTGLTEEELRKEKKFRKILSEAQKQKGDKTKYERNLINFIKNITKETKISILHPDFKNILREKINKSSSWGWYGYGFFCTKNVDDIIKKYLSLRKKNRLNKKK